MIDVSVNTPATSASTEAKTMFLKRRVIASPCVRVGSRRLLLDAVLGGIHEVARVDADAEDVEGVVKAAADGHDRPRLPFRVDVDRRLPRQVGGVLADRARRRDRVGGEPADGALA